MMAIAEKLDRGRLDELGLHFAPQVVLFTALRLGIFPAIAKGAKSVNSIASATDCSARGMRMVLDCMTAMGLLEKEAGTYVLNDLSRNYFLPSNKDYVGGLFLQCDQLLKLWLTLPEAVRTGRPTLGLFTEEEKERLHIGIVDALFQVHKIGAWGLVDVLQDWVGDPATIKILDVAAGSAVWSIPFALKCERVEVTAIDFAPVLEVARKYTRQFGVENRYRFLGANIREIEFESDEYDLALLGHICHSEGAEWSQRLIGECFRALRRNGRLFIMDYIPDEGRKSEILPSLMALNALLGTEEGDTFTFSQYQRWLLKAGFREAYTLRVHDSSPIIVGLKG